MTPQDHIKLNKAKCLSVSLFVKFKVIELLTQLKIYFNDRVPLNFPFQTTLKTDDIGGKYFCNLMGYKTSS